MPSTPTLPLNTGSTSRRSASACGNPPGRHHAGGRPGRASPRLRPHRHGPHLRQRARRRRRGPPSGVPRERVFVTTKLWNDDQGYDSALRAFDASLERLGLDYVDLYLIHWPVAEKRLELVARARAHLRREARARDRGEQLPRPPPEGAPRHAKVVPAVNQIEVHPFLQQRETPRVLQGARIVVEAYSPLTHGSGSKIRWSPRSPGTRSGRTRRCSFGGESSTGWWCSRSR